MSLAVTLAKIANKAGVFPHFKQFSSLSELQIVFFFLKRTMSDQVTILVRQNNNVVGPNQRRVNTGRLITVI